MTQKPNMFIFIDKLIIKINKNIKLNNEFSELSRLLNRAIKEYCSLIKIIYKYAFQTLIYIYSIKIKNEVRPTIVKQDFLMKKVV